MLLLVLVSSDCDPWVVGDPVDSSTGWTDSSEESSAEVESVDGVDVVADSSDSSDEETLSVVADASEELDEDSGRVVDVGRLSSVLDGVVISDSVVDDTVEPPSASDPSIVEDVTVCWVELVLSVQDSVAGSSVVSDESSDEPSTTGFSVDSEEDDSSVAGDSVESGVSVDECVEANTVGGVVMSSVMRVVAEEHS